MDYKYVTRKGQEIKAGDVLRQIHDTNPETFKVNWKCGETTNLRIVCELNDELGVYEFQGSTNNLEFHPLRYAYLNDDYNKPIILTNVEILNNSQTINTFLIEYLKQYKQELDQMKSIQHEQKRSFASELKQLADFARDDFDIERFDDYHSQIFEGFDAIKKYDKEMLVYYNSYLNLYNGIMPYIIGTNDLSDIVIIKDGVELSFSGLSMLEIQKIMAQQGISLSDELIYFSKS